MTTVEPGERCSSSSSRTSVTLREEVLLCVPEPSAYVQCARARCEPSDRGGRTCSQAVGVVVLATARRKTPASPAPAGPLSTAITASPGDASVRIAVSRLAIATSARTSALGPSCVADASRRCPAGTPASSMSPGLYGRAESRWCPAPPARPVIVCVTASPTGRRPRNPSSRAAQRSQRAWRS